MEKTIIFSLSANKELTKKVCDYLNLPEGECEVLHFADGEEMIKIKQTVRGYKVFIIQSICNPASENLMELLMCVDAIKRSSPADITCVIPYYGYARQDRMVEPRQPITAKLVAKMIETAGANRVVSLDLHTLSIQGFFDIPVDSINAGPVIANYVKRMNIENLTVVSPDHGGVKRARNLAEKLNVPIAVIDKRRPKENVCEASFILGDVKDRNVVIIDDICDTAGSLVAASKILKENGAKDIYVAITHGVLSGDAVKKIEDSEIKKVIITDTIPLKQTSDKIEVISISHMIGEVIKAISEETSIGETYDKFK